jgi:hypothetical protein
MIWMHPQQQVYFNALPGRNLEDKFELDYWALSYRWGLEWITRHDSRPKLLISAPLESCVETNRWMLNSYDMERVKFMGDTEKADYFITTYRFHPGPYPYADEVAQLRVSGQRILSIFRLR